MARGVMLLCALCLLAASAAFAAQDDAQGDDGDPGQAGGDALATAVSDDPENVATASGGLGGAADPDDGFAGGDGGAATATAETTRSGGGDATATATGGDAGEGRNGSPGGRGGDGHATAGVETTGDDENASAVASAEGGHGGDADGAGLVGDGGDATAEAHGSHHGGRLFLRALALGGDAGSPDDTPDDAHGGDAMATTHATTSGDGDDLFSTSSVRGGDGGAQGHGGDAAAHSVGIAEGNAAVFVSNSVRGGDGGTGGDAHSSAVGRGEGDGRVEVSVSALAGSGPAGSNPGGTATLDASAVSLGGGTVIVGGMARASDFSDVLLDDAIRGETTGELVLLQEAFASTGRARSTLTRSGAHEALRVETLAQGAEALARSEATNTAGGASVRAVAVADRSDAVPPSTSVASAAATALGDVEVTAISTADPSTGGSEASLGEVSGVSSSGGSVRVSGSVWGGGVDDRLGDGQDVVLDDAVRGETSGALALHQRAVGGVGTWGGEAGSATSLLTHTGALEHLELASEATGGFGETGTFPTSEESGVGGTGRAGAHAENTVGGVVVNVRADGGDSIRGGDASAEASATTHTDGADIALGTASGGPGGGTIEGGGTGAFGGQGGEAEPGFVSDGGSATSSSTARALGDAAVTVYDRAFGGDATESGARSEATKVGHGGAARSAADAETGGTSSVQTFAVARGGEGGILNEFPSGIRRGRGGDAHADARSVGLGEAVALADAVAGNSTGRNGGSAVATANAKGSSGIALAQAAGSSRLVTRFGVTSETNLSGGVAAASTFHVGASGAKTAEENEVPTDIQATAVLLPDRGGLPGGGGAGGTGTGGGTGTRIERVASLALEVEPGDGAASELRHTASMAFDTLDDVRVGDVALVFSDGDGFGESFESLLLTVMRADDVVFEELLESLDAVEDFFDGTVIELQGTFDELPDGTGEAALLTLQLDWTSAGSGWGFRGHVGLLAEVPEPGSALLVALGLVALGSRRSRRR